ncbi:MAG: Cytochrome c oxidase subunit, partial [Pseudonocardiales bacterium]|nr:Cytochrome c oxidase subunit [Pseudonocardiales bacterium]
MKVESRIFEICTAFFFLCAIVYGLLSHEAVGIVGL